MKSKSKKVAADEMKKCLKDAMELIAGLSLFIADEKNGLDDRRFATVGFPVNAFVPLEKLLCGVKCEDVDLQLLEDYANVWMRFFDTFGCYEIVATAKSALLQLISDWYRYGSDGDIGGRILAGEYGCLRVAFSTVMALWRKKISGSVFSEDRIFSLEKSRGVDAKEAQIREAVRLCKEGRYSESERHLCMRVLKMSTIDVDGISVSIENIGYPNTKKGLAAFRRKLDREFEKLGLKPRFNDRV